MEIRRTHCEKFVTDDSGDVTGVVEKKKFNTMKSAQKEADYHNQNFKIKEKLTPYQCRVCKKFHNGRTGELITQDDMDEIWDRTKPEKYRVPELKIIGKLDLSKIPLSNKQRKRMAKEKRKQENKK